MSTRPLLEVEDLVVVIHTPRGPVRAVDGVSLRVEAGRTLGIVGESGSGKSMLLRTVMGLHPPYVERRGRVVFDGTDLTTLGASELRRLWGTRIAMVLQNPLSCLNPVQRVGAALAETLRFHRGLRGREARLTALQLIRSVGIADPERRLRQYPHQLSGGMRQRVAIAAALASDPQLLLADEPTTALDVTVQAQILDLLAKQQEARGMGMVLVSHDLGVVARHADDIAVMYGGQIVEHAPARELFREPRMPYTQLLLRAMPRLDEPAHSRLAVIPGGPPDPHLHLAGCRFAARCPHVHDRCEEAPPLTVLTEQAHACRCWLVRAEAVL